MRKITSLLLALLMVFALATTAFAASGTNDNNGKITIENAVKDQTYTIYQILYLESYNTTEGSEAYSYKATLAWKNFVEGTEIKDVYLKTDTQGYVTWVEGADVAAFAKLAKAYATQNRIEGQGTKKAESNTVTFENLNLGYYLLDSTLGTLCSLDTTNPDVIVKEKNEVPTIDKLVKEDSTNTYGETNTAQIGDTVEFKTTIHAKKGAQNYVVHDQMDAGLTLDKTSFKVQVNNVDIASSNYTVKTDELSDSCTFEISFTKDYLDTITADTDIVITYSAVLNENAKISEESNNNKTKLSYGENSSTEWDETKTYTFQFDIIKTDSNKKLLSGAKFELYDAQTDGNKIALVKESDGTYRVATTTEKNGEGFTSAVIEAGKVTVKGLDGNTTYWLEETEAPAGYNKLAGRVEVKIESRNLTTTMTGDTWNDNDGGVQITNNSGTELPSTGGMGTTIFYIFGSILVLGAAVLLVTKKRMSAET